MAIDAHVVGRRQTGNETYVVNLADALLANGSVDPLVYVDRGGAWPGVSDVPRRELRTRSPFLRIPFELPYRSARDGADLLHVQYVGPPFGPVPMVATIHDISFEDLPDAFPRRTTLRLRTLIPMTARRAAVVVASSTYTRDRLLHHYDLDPNRVVVAPLGVSASWRPPDADDLRRRVEALRLPPRYVLAVGNLHPRKNIPRLVRAVAEARRSGDRELALVLVGQRSWRAAEVDRAIDDVGGEAWVSFTGYVADDDLRALYAAATVFAYPSYYEGFGLPVLEAMACGAAVVAADATSVPEVAGDAAILIDPFDQRAMAGAIASLASDPEANQRLRVAALARAAGFSWPACAEATIAAYRLALAR